MYTQLCTQIQQVLKSSVPEPFDPRLSAGIQLLHGFTLSDQLEYISKHNLISCSLQLDTSPIFIFNADAESTGRYGSHSSIDQCQEADYYDLQLQLYEVQFEILKCEEVADSAQLESIKRLMLYQV